MSKLTPCIICEQDCVFTFCSDKCEREWCVNWEQDNDVVSSSPLVGTRLLRSGINE